MMAAMADVKDEDRERAAHLGHFKHLRKIAGLLATLHHSGCARDTAGNRAIACSGSSSGSHF